MALDYMFICEQGIFIGNKGLRKGTKAQGKTIFGINFLTRLLELYIDGRAVLRDPQNCSNVATT